MEKDNNIYLKNIIDKAQEAIEYCENYTAESFLSDEKTQSAVILKLIVIGEEAKKLPEEIKNNINLPWKMIIGFRNMAVHEYFNIEMSQIWETIKNDLPVLIKEIQAYLAK
jgi:uncharacterized protein with HEPN domain